MAKLRLWADSAAADLALAETIAGEPPALSEPVHSLLARATVRHEGSGLLTLARPISPSAVASIQEALQQSHAASEGVIRIATTVVNNAARELEAGASLRALIGSKLGADGGCRGRLGLLLKLPLFGHLIH